MDRYNKLAVEFEVLLQQYSELLNEIDGLRSQSAAELQVILNMNAELEATRKKLNIAVEALNWYKKYAQINQWVGNAMAIEALTEIDKLNTVNNGDGNDKI